MLITGLEGGGWDSTNGVDLPQMCCHGGDDDGRVRMTPWQTLAHLVQRPLYTLPGSLPPRLFWPYLCSLLPTSVNQNAGQRRSSS